MKYYIVEKNGYDLRSFESLASAYKFYLEDVAKRIILKEVAPKVVEGGE